MVTKCLANRVHSVQESQMRRSLRISLPLQSYETQAVTDSESRKQSLKLPVVEFNH